MTIKQARAEVKRIGLNEPKRLLQMLEAMDMTDEDKEIITKHAIEGKVLPYCARDMHYSVGRTWAKWNNAVEKYRRRSGGEE